MVALITLTTDFGTRDSYVAEMKGAILAVTRAVHLVDLTHEIAPHDVLEGALVLEAAAAVFPPATIHVAVVDPGVGTARRGIAVAAGGQLFVGPDNGLCTPFLGAGGWRAVELRSPEYRRPVVSRTFHGRDLFAPAAAHLALGVPLERFGPPVDDPARLPWPVARVERTRVAGVVLHVDRFGNLVTSIRAASVETMGAGSLVRIRGRALPVVGTYADLARGRAGALVGSRGRLEVVVREGSAAAVLGARRGMPVVLSRRTSSRTPPSRRRSTSCPSRPARC